MTSSKFSSSLRFDERATDYALSRPTYGADVIDFILAGMPRPLQVADIGAGTGISSRLFASRGAIVAAIDPNALMREQAEPYTGVTYLDGTGEATGLSTASVDLLTAFQAFHWFANAAALAECMRIVRPNGRAALVLNERDERDPFTASYGELYRRYALDDTEDRRMRSIDVFKQLPGDATERQFTQVQTLDRDGLARRTASTSYLPRHGEAAKQLHADVDALFERYADDGLISIALRTVVVKIDLRHLRKANVER